MKLEVGATLVVSSINKELRLEAAEKSDDPRRESVYPWPYVGWSHGI